MRPGNQRFDPSLARSFDYGEYTFAQDSGYFFAATAGTAVFWKLYVPPNFLLNRSTRPAVSTNFCLPVKKGWQALQISTLIFGCVLRVTKVLPQAHLTVLAT
jgi:hypothetical protein